MQLDNLSHEARSAVVDAVLEVLGVTSLQARDALREYRANDGVSQPAELHIPINKDFDFRLYGMKVVVDAETDKVIAQSLPKKELQ